MNIHRDMVTCIYAIEFYQATYSMTNAEGRNAIYKVEPMIYLIHILVRTYLCIKLLCIQDRGGHFLKNVAIAL
jgi:hypothetical protein